MALCRFLFFIYEDVVGGTAGGERVYLLRYRAVRNVFCVVDLVGNRAPGAGFGVEVVRVYCFFLLAALVAVIFGSLCSLGLGVSLVIVRTAVPAVV